MNFELPDDISDEAERMRLFAKERREHPGPSGFDHETWRALSALGLFASALPSSWGGTERGALAVFAMFEALGRGGIDRSVLFAMGAHLFGCAVPIATYATAEQTARWGTGLAAGVTIGALAVTEPAGGSSLELVATEAAETTGGYIVRGEKTLVCNAPQASLFLVLARHSATSGPFGLSALLVPAGTEGLSVAPIASTCGMRDAPMGNVRLADCFVPSHMVLGRPGAGLKVFATAMQWERTCLLAGFLGAAERDLAITVDTLRERRDAGGPLWRHQAISHPLARLKLKLDCARLIAHRAACMIDRHDDNHVAAAMAKIAMSEAVVETAEQCLRLMAGSAWKAEPIDFGTALADTLGGLFASGTTEIQLDVLARALQIERHAK